MTKLIEIEGIGKVYAQTLAEKAGLETVEGFLQAAATPKGREELAEKTGISPKLILEWANRADLSRLKGVGEEYSDLLEAAGVDTVRELAQRNPDNLYEKLKEVKEQKKLVRRLPGKADVARWVEEAKSLPPILTY
jgi:predicted flap endonuclease-1-like 5' DNA nuclease